MSRNKVYLEAAGRTQELLNIKWTLKSGGFRIGSSWHEDSGIKRLTIAGSEFLMLGADSALGPC
jgi:hypothetical protein